MIDIVTVVYDSKTADLAQAQAPLLRRDPCIGKIILVDNRPENRGFAKACNLGALEATAEIIGFLNPDTVINGTLEAVERCFAANPKTMVTGERFGKTDEILDVWCIENGGWVCGAAFFVRAEWWRRLHGFDEIFTFGFEETDFCRRTQLAGFDVTPIHLPIDHHSPEDDSTEVRVYKTYYLNRGWALYREKHGIRF
jgi:N-acetylglucosaminyl-diphospho-decaprenol L-rhamnosyltransferase